MSNAVFIYLSVEVSSGVARRILLTLNSSPVQETSPDSMMRRSATEISD